VAYFNTPGAFGNTGRAVCSSQRSRSCSGHGVLISSFSTIYLAPLSPFRMAPPSHSASLSERYMDKLYGRKWSDGFSSLSCYLICIYTHLAFPSTNQTTTTRSPQYFQHVPHLSIYLKNLSTLPQKPTKNHHRSHKSIESPLHRTNPLPPVPPPPGTSRPLSLPPLPPSPAETRIIPPYTHAPAYGPGDRCLIR